MHKKGVTIVELLGAIVIFGLMSSLIAVLVSFIINSNDRIAEQSRATTIRTKIEVDLNRHLQELSPTSFSDCGLQMNCVTLELTYAYVVNETSESIDLVVYTPPIQLRLELIDSALYINSVLYVIDYFELSDESSITYTQTLHTLDLSVHLVLTAPSDKTYTIVWQKQINLSSIPTP